MRMSRVHLFANLTQRPVNSQMNGQYITDFLYIWYLLTGMGPDAQFLPGDIIPPSSTPEPIMMSGQEGPFGPGGPPRSLVGSHFTQSMNNHPAHMEMAAEAW